MGIVVMTSYRFRPEDLILVDNYLTTKLDLGFCFHNYFILSIMHGQKYQRYVSDRVMGM